MYYHESTIVYYEGQFVKASEARGNLYDQSLHYGYGAFEGIRSYNTQSGVQIFKGVEHYERLKFSCEAVGIPFPYATSELMDLTYELLERNNLSDAYIRPLVTCPPNMSLTAGKRAQLFIAAWQWGAYLGNTLLRLKTASFRRIAPACFKVEAKVSGHYVNSIMATQEAKDAGYDEALLLDINGYVAEGPGANFFLEKDGVLYTPQLGSILPGITRATVMEICGELGIPVVEKLLTPEEVYKGDAAFYCGTAAEVAGIASLDHYAFPKAFNESLGATLQKAYKCKVLHQQYQPYLATA
jgi:branched-chain amino acid aminotransferase